MEGRSAVPGLGDSARSGWAVESPQPNLRGLLPLEALLAFYRQRLHWLSWKSDTGLEFGGMSQGSAVKGGKGLMDR